MDFYYYFYYILHTFNQEVKDSIDSFNMHSPIPIEKVRSRKEFPHPHYSDTVILKKDDIATSSRFHAAGIIPHIVSTPKEAQKLIDELNLESDEHACTPESPCHMDRPHHSHPNEWCGHLGFIEWCPKQNRPLGVIIPSWHSDLLSEWEKQHKISLEKNPKAYMADVPAPISYFVIEVLDKISKDDSMRFPFNKVTSEKKMYYLMTMTASDNVNSHEAKPSKWQNTSIQLLAGKVDTIRDTPQRSSMRSTQWNLQTGLNGALREFHEETLNRFRPDIYTSTVLNLTRYVQLTQCIRKNCEDQCRLVHRLPKDDSIHKFTCGCKLYRHMFLLPIKCPSKRDLVKLNRQIIRSFMP